MTDPIIRLPPVLRPRPLSPRDRHIILTARVKRKVMAAAWRALRKQDRRKANQQFKEIRTRRRGYCQT